MGSVQRRIPWQVVPSKKFIYGSACGFLLCLAAVHFYLSASEESIDVVVMRPGVHEALSNTVEPEKLGRRVVLRNVVTTLMALQEEVRSTQDSSERSRQSLLRKIGEQIEGAKAANSEVTDRLTQQLNSMQQQLEQKEEELRKQVEQQAEMLRQQAATVAMAEAEYLSRHKQPEQHNYTLWRITEDRPELWRQRSFRRYAAYGFVKFSAYRVSRSRVAVLGLAARGLHKLRRLTSCEWHSARDGTVVNGALQMLYSGEHHDYIYETVVLNCNLNDNLKEGGGFVKAMIDSEITYLYSEPEGTPLDPIPSNGFEYNLVFCGPPMYGEMNERLVREWLEYHHLYLGADHFVLYDSGAVSPAMLQAIDDPFVRKKLVTITDFRESNEWDVWLWAQALVIHDCSYRMRPLAKWVFMHDFDEFLHVAPPQTLREVLAKYEDRAWITHGCIVFSIEYCTADAKKYVGVSGQESSDGRRGSSNGGMLIAPMQFRWPHIYCQKPGVDKHMCIDQWGHRKYIVNPRKAKLFQIHIVIENENGMKGVDTSVHELRHMHFQGLAKRGRELCQKGPPKDWWWHYSGVETICRAVTTCRNRTDPQTCTLREVERIRAEKQQQKQDASAKVQDQAADQTADEQVEGG